MRIIRICTNNPHYLSRFYSEDRALETAPYTESYKTLKCDCYGWADFWTDAFSRLGYEVWEPVANAEIMQKKWAVENGVDYDEVSWLKEIVLTQIKSFNPDILFTNDNFTFDKNFLNTARNECKNLKLIIGWCACPHSGTDAFDAYDLVISSIPEYVDEFKNSGLKTEYMKHCFSPLVLERLKSQKKETAIDFSFIGSVVKRPEFHMTRERMLTEFIRKSNIKMWGRVTKPGLKKRILKLLKLYSDNDYPSIEIRRRMKAPVFGLSMFSKIAASRVSLNIHGDNSEKSASNMRLYETSGVGSCLLTENQPNLKEIFEPDREVLAYNSVDEAIEKLEYILEHEDERLKIAEAGQKRTLKEHTFYNRAQQLDSMIKKMI